MISLGRSYFPTQVTWKIPGDIHGQNTTFVKSSSREEALAYSPSSAKVTAAP